MKVYVSGGVSDCPDYKERFSKAERKLKAAGFEVVNPAKNQGYSYKQYIDIGLFELMHCDGIYMLDGWKASNGARLEYQYAVTVGMTVLKE